ncbi:TonB C-terminal domain-containing protein [Paraburkholderia sp. BCC1885]|uniref:TonB C-terminal domain-containing protein n=1 Tax=Paraburkholderia sp. BCC1885 TaxID=2562669 RepID=UPI0016424470|nr:TonB C-terminal domain-containing protein [Paraburkholderia sp. BCC1885]
MTRNRRWLLAVVVSTVSWLAACTSGTPSANGEPPLPSADEVTRRCLVRATANGASRPALDQLNAVQWRMYVGCALSSNLSVASTSVPDNPEGVVSIHFDSAGAVSSVGQLGSSGNPAWDAAIQRAIAAASPLPAIHASHEISRVDLHFRPQPQPRGIGGSTGLTGESHWSVHHCNTVGSATACD